MIKRTSTSTEMAVKALPKEEKKWDQIVPMHYHRWQKVFLEEEAKRYPQHQPWDIAIDLVKVPQKYWIARYTRLHLQNREDSRNTFEKTWRKDISDLRTPSIPHPFSLLGKRMGSSNQWSITGS